MNKTKAKIISAVISAVMLLNCAVINANAAGDVAGAVEGTWNQAKGQIKTVTNNVIFPVIDVVLAILLFVNIGLMYMEYRKRGQIEWTPIAVIFGCLLFSLTAPAYIWNIVNI